MREALYFRNISFSDIARYENMARFWPGPGPDMISGATLKLSMTD